MKTSIELCAALNMVLARLESNPRTAAEWQVIRDTLRDAERYADKCRGMRERLEADEQ